MGIDIHNLNLLAHAQDIDGYYTSLLDAYRCDVIVKRPDYYIYGNPQLQSDQQTLGKWFNTSPQIWVQRPPDTLRTAKLYSPNIRRNTAPQVSATLLRNFRIRERQNFQFRASAFNLTNTPIFGAPNNNPASPLFGVVSITQINLPRALEMGFRYSF